MKPLLQVKNLSKSHILHEISFEMERGEMLAVMGPSGSGKSTLLYNVAGMDRPTAGEVWLRDTEITGLSEDEKAALDAGMNAHVAKPLDMQLLKKVMQQCAKQTKT